MQIRKPADGQTTGGEHNFRGIQTDTDTKMTQEKEIDVTTEISTPIRTNGHIPED